MKSFLLFFLFAFPLYSLVGGEINLRFVVDEPYLVIHTLTCRGFSSEHHKSSLLAFQKEVWEKEEAGYRALPPPWEVVPEAELSPALQKFLASVRMLETFQPVLAQTLAYRDFCGMQWRETYAVAKQYITETVGFELETGDFGIYITHPSLTNGYSMGDRRIGWGCSGSFGYYDAVYIWHEILHSYLPKDPISHCLIQLISDNGLRVVLNEEEQMIPLIGHPHLSPLMEKIYSRWEAYLQRSDRNIFKLLEELQAEEAIEGLSREIGLVNGYFNAEKS